MRKINLLLIGVFLFLSSCNVLAQESFTEDNITYTVTGENSVTVTGHTITSNTDLDIPSDVTHNEVTYLVEHIGDEAFLNCEELTDLTLPSTILSVGTSAFEGCENITMLMHNGEGSIGARAFSGCNRLTDIVFSDLITSIGEDAFKECSLLTVNFPKSLTSIASTAFSSATSSATTVDIGASITLAEKDNLVNFLRVIDHGIDDYNAYDLRLNGGNTYYSTNSDKTLLFNKTKTTLFYAQMYDWNIDRELYSLNTLTTIGKRACAEMEPWSVFFPSTVTTIEDEAFKDGILSAIYFLSENPPTLGENVFSGNTTLYIHINNVDSTAWKTAWGDQADNCKFYIKHDLYNITTPTFYDQTCEWQGLPGAVSISPTGSLETNGNYNNIFYHYTNLDLDMDFYFSRTLPTDTWSFIGNLQPARTQYKHLCLTDDYENYNFFAASPFDYTNNAWGDYATSTQTMPSAGKGFFIYPFKEYFTDLDYPFYNWSSSTNSSATPNTSETVELDNDYTYMLYDSFASSTMINQQGKAPFNSDGITVSNTNNGAVNGGGKWFALSNPYIGRLNMYSFYNFAANKTAGESKIQGGVIYTYNSTTNDWDDPLDITDPDNIVALMPGTGFLVASKDNASTLSLKFNDKLTLQKRDWSKLATTKSYSMDKIVFSAKANEIEKRMLAKLDDQASNGFDGKDAYVLMSSNHDVVNPYFLVEGEHILNNHFNSLPYITDINFHSYKDNEVEFSCQNSNPDIEVSIIDIQNNNSETVLNNGEVFNISCSEGDNAGRYKIKFARKNVGINEVASEDNSIQIWNNAREVTIDGKDLRRVEIYNTLGQMVYSSSLAGNSTTFDSNLNDGAYIIKAYTSNSSKSKKVIIK